MKICQTCGFAIISALHNAIRSIGKSCEISHKNFRDRNSAIPVHRKSQPLHVHRVLMILRTQCSRMRNQLGENPTRPYVETAWRNALRDNKDQAETSCIDFRVEGESDLSTDEEERERSLNVSLMKQILESPKKDTVDCRIIFQRRRQGVPREFSGCQGHCEKHRANLKLVKFSWSQTQMKCKSCNNYETPRHTSLQMWFFIPGASGEVEKQVLQNVMNCFLHAHNKRICFFFQTGKAQMENNW